MFTGIVEEVGEVSEFKSSLPFSRLNIRAHKVLEETKCADSILVNGVCLTVVDIRESNFTVEIISQTLEKTALGKLRKGSKVNLERALSPFDRLGGHLVTGDIDGVARVKDINREKEQMRMRIQPPSSLMKYIVNQGRVGVEGVSLTVAEVEGEDFTVYLIPFTLTNTTLSLKKRGDFLNLEVDIISKYVEKILEKGSFSREKIDREFLKKTGFK
ncbi:MAG: riboflavin synthase [Candidatus Aerophobetes bacterium]|nr:riboflavin synthase [Candidatus Aerophobetes bacterium]